MTTRRRFDESIPALGTTWTSRAPAVTPDFVTPAAQALFLGVLGGLMVGLVVAAFSDLPLVGVAAGAAIPSTLGAFLWRLSASDKTLWGAERIVNRDLDHDGAVGQPEPASWRPPIILNGYAGRQRAAAEDREQGRADFERFVMACEHNTASRAHPGLSRESYRAYRDSLLNSGHARWRRPGDEKAGWELVSTAAEVLEALC